MNLPASRLQRVLNEAPIPFRLGDYISQGFEFMNKNLGLLVAFMLLSTIIGMFVQAIPVAGMALSILIGPVLQIGYAQFTYVAQRERRADFAEFFRGFNKLMPLLSTYLLHALIAFASMLPGLILWYRAGLADWAVLAIEDYPFLDSVPPMEESVDMGYFWLGLLLIFVGIFVITTLFSWALHIVWFFNVSPMEALGVSRQLIARHWSVFIGFTLLTGLIAAAGVLLCGVGLLYTVPAMACAQFFAFAEAVRLFENDDRDHETDIIDHFIA